MEDIAVERYFPHIGSHVGDPSLGHAVSDLRLRQQHHEIRVVQNVLDLPAVQQVFHILRQRRGDVALLRSIFQTATK